MSKDWPRPGWTPTGRPASVFCFIPGEPLSDGLQISRSRYHVEGVPESLALSAHARADSPEWFAGFFTRPGLGSGIEKALGASATEVIGAARGIVVRGEFPDPPDLGYLRDSVGVVSALLDAGGLAVLDLLACTWYSKVDWHGRFVERTGFRVEDHVVINSSDDDHLHPGLWVHTRGMRKFGRPDFQIKHVPGPWPDDNPMIRASGQLLNTLAAQACLGTAYGDGETVAFPGQRRRCTFRLTPDDIDSLSCHFGNEVLEIVDLVRGKPGEGLTHLLSEIAGL